MERLKIEAFFDLRREKLQRWWGAWSRENFSDVDDCVHDDNLIDNHVDNVDHDIDNVFDDNDNRVDDDDYDNNDDDDDDNADDLCKLSARCRRFA